MASSAAKPPDARASGQHQPGSGSSGHEVSAYSLRMVKVDRIVIVRNGE